MAPPGKSAGHILGSKKGRAIAAAPSYLQGVWEIVTAQPWSQCISWAKNLPRYWHQGRVVTGKRLQH